MVKPIFWTQVALKSSCVCFDKTQEGRSITLNVPLRCYAVPTIKHALVDGNHDKLS